MDSPLVKINFGPYDNGLIRLRGFSGLGNLLCTWGEAMLYAKKNDFSVIWPTWPQLSISALKYDRIYFDVFKNDGTYVEGLNRFRGLTKYIYSDKSEIISIGPKIPYNMDWEYGENSLSNAEWLHERLKSIVSPKYQKRINSIGLPDKFIGMHIRRGDFMMEAHHFKDNSGRHVNKAIELDWYVEAIEKVRNVSGNVPVVCISDANESELKSVLALSNVYLQKEKPIVDLLTLSKANAFIGSGSTFSQWIAYLGQMDTWVNKDHTWCDTIHLQSQLKKL